MIIPCEHDPRGCSSCRVARRQARALKRYHANKEQYKQNSQRWHQENKAKKAAHTRRWRKNNPEKVREQGSDMRFGQKRLEKMFVDQKGQCGICRGSLADGFHTDHNHALPNQPNVRTLLCDKCNPGLGCFCDSPELLREAADYLDRHRHPGPNQLSFDFMLE